jgi:hypothetical protein
MSSHLGLLDFNKRNPISAGWRHNQVLIIIPYYGAPTYAPTRDSISRDRNRDEMMICVPKVCPRTHLMAVARTIRERGF